MTRRRPRPAPVVLPCGGPAENFSSKMEAVLGEGDKDEALKKLIAEQEADHEPSPFDEDPPKRPRKVYTPKRLSALTRVCERPLLRNSNSSNHFHDQPA